MLEYPAHSAIMDGMSDGYARVMNRTRQGVVSRPGEPELRKDNMDNVKDMAKAYLELVRLIGLIIQRSESIPSGHLYARVMGSLDLDLYNQVIGTLMKAGLVEEKHYLLTWIGPKAESENTEDSE